MPGPLPQPQRRRRNAPTIPTTKLPAGGRRGPVPRVPKGYDLGDRGKAWWRWAWRLPQACAWSAGDLYALARRAELEDDLERASEPNPGGLDLLELFNAGDDPRELAQIIDFTLRRLQQLAAGKLAIEREMRELDNRFGLTPKGMADLRWTIVPDETSTGGAGDEDDDEVTRRRREREAKYASG
jgi:hypothetical protein